MISNNDKIKIPNKKGFNFYCQGCNEIYRWKDLKELKNKVFSIMACPKCLEIVEDLKIK